MPSVSVALVAAAVAVLSLVGPAACGGAGEGPVVVRVGSAGIGKGTVERWTHVISRGGALQALRGRLRGTPRQRALDALISGEWIVAEAARERLSVSEGLVDRALEERRQANGEAEFQEALQAGGETVDDVKLEIRAELSAARIRRRLATEAARVTQSEVAGFYEHNRRLFVIPEVRDVELIENLPSPNAATALVRRIGTGASFAKRALKEALQRNPEGASSTPDIEGVTAAIFAAPAGVVSRPMSLNHRWTVFIVRKVKPASLKPLVGVRGEVVRRVTALRRRELLASFDREYKARWTARTSCRPGYVVEKCSRYDGPRAAEESPFAAE